jgi:hypothetical protein
MDTAEHPIASIRAIAPGDLVTYHGSLTPYHGLYIAQFCPCGHCHMEFLWSGEMRYALTDPWDTDADKHPQHVRRQSITRSTACA